MTSDDAGKMQYQSVFDAIQTFWHRAAMPRRLDMQIEQYWMAKKASSSNPLVRSGAKYFSQNDEDSILLEILRRIGLERGIALELGVGDGLENNTLILLMLGWQVLWFEGEDLKFSVPSKCGNLQFEKAWIARDNCAELVPVGAASMGLKTLDMICTDLDGNDIYVVESLLEAGHRPSVYIVEYNGKFPPPIKWRIKYDPSHSWDSSDYQGAFSPGLCGCHEHGRVHTGMLQYHRS